MQQLFIYQELVDDNLVNLDDNLVIPTTMLADESEATIGAINATVNPVINIANIKFGK